MTPHIDRTTKSKPIHQYTNKEIRWHLAWEWAVLSHHGKVPFPKTGGGVQPVQEKK